MSPATPVARPTRPAPEPIPADDAAKLAEIGDLLERILDRVAMAENFLSGQREEVSDEIKQAMADAIREWIVPDLAAAAWRGCDLLSALENRPASSGTVAQ